MSKVPVSLLAGLLLIGVACTSKANISPPGGTRDRLTVEELMAAQYLGDGPIHNGYFMPVGNWGPAHHEFEGTLSIPEFAMSAAWADRAIRDLGAEGRRLFPGGDLQFFTYQAYLVPVVRDNVRAPRGESDLGMMVSPGRIWSEPGDDGFSRASFPFVLTNRVANDSHNGIATFLYDGDRVSSLRFQIVQEEAPWAKVDYWGQSPVTYDPGEIDNREILSGGFVDELKQQTPISPWSALVDKSAFRIVANFSHRSGKTEDISLSGLIVDDVIYAQPCHTRFGDYPYCRYMRHGVFSVTKSMGAALTMFRLARKYGDGIFDLKIKDYVPLTADHDGWNEVSFADVLNMATGVGYESPERELVEKDANEDSPPFGDNPRLGMWLRAPSAREKLSLALSTGTDYPWGPGEVARYDTMHTFILAAAMDGFLKSKEGPDADLWDMMIEEVLRPIGVFHAPIMRTVEPDGARGIAIMGYGLYPTIDDVAKISRLLQNGGRHRGRQLLSGHLVDKALYRTEARGLPTGWQTPHGQYDYHMSFWLMPYVTKDACKVWIPNMIGHGGNFVLLLPNGVTAFRFADHYDYDSSDLVTVGNEVRPLCAP